SAALIRALDEEHNEEARAKLAAALGAAGDREAIAALVRALDKAREFDTRVALARALDRLGDARGTLHFLDALGSSGAAERVEAVRGLSLLTGEPPHHDVERWRAWWREYAERYRRE